MIVITISLTGKLFVFFVGGGSQRCDIESGRGGLGVGLRSGIETE